MVQQSKDLAAAPTDKAKDKQLADTIHRMRSRVDSVLSNDAICAHLSAHSLLAILLPIVLLLSPR